MGKNTIITTEKTHAEIEIDKFLNHEKHQYLRQLGKEHKFAFELMINHKTNKKIRFGGIIKKLRSTFYPKYKEPSKRRNESSSKGKVMFSFTVLALF